MYQDDKNIFVLGTSKTLQIFKILLMFPYSKNQFLNTLMIFFSFLQTILIVVSFILPPSEETHASALSKTLGSAYYLGCMSKNFKNISFEFFNISILTGYGFTHTICCSESLLRRNTLNKFYKKVDKINEDLNACSTIKRSFFILKFKTLSFLILYFILNTPIYLQGYSVFKWHIILFLIYMFISLYKCIFYGFHVEIIRILLLKIKLRLKNVLKEQKTKPQESLETVANEIEECRYEYGKLIKLVSLVNKSFGASMVFILVQIIFTFTSIIYWFVDNIIAKYEEGRNYYNLFSMSFTFFIVLLVCHSSQSCTNLVSFFLYIVTKVLS